MHPHASAPDDLALHGPRVLGFASASRVATRWGLPAPVVADLLLDHEARGFVRHTSFGGSSGWALTDSGRIENERRLSAELDETGTRDVVTDAHARFLPLNRRFGRACTRWQIRPTPTDPVAFNDHRDWAWDEGVLRNLAALEADLRDLCARLTAHLLRFDGYAARYSTALARVGAGERRWVDAPDLDSCHTVWIQLHEDLLASLGIPRGSDG